MPEAKLILLGAGPGDPELITLKGLRAIREADIILYDSLVNPKIFDLAFDKNLLGSQDSAEKIFVGKRCGKHSMSQDQINELILENLKKGLTVLRLKGGDPFIFARGVEEYKLAVEAGYTVEVIPGLSSGLALPVINKITLSYRAKSEIVSLVTGHNFNEAKKETWLATLNSGGTLVIYMGLSKLVKIVETFQADLGMDFPITIIQNGSLDNEMLIESTLGEVLQETINYSETGSPSLIIMGQHINSAKKQSFRKDPNKFMNFQSR
jgi:uroporphyrin-III C-methyltransferase